MRCIHSAGSIEARRKLELKLQQASGGSSRLESKPNISIVTYRPNVPHRAVKDEALHGTTGETSCLTARGYHWRAVLIPDG